MTGDYKASICNIPNASTGGQDSQIKRKKLFPSNNTNNNSFFFYFRIINGNILQATGLIFWRKIYLKLIYLFSCICLLIPHLCLRKKNFSDKTNTAY